MAHQARRPTRVVRVGDLRIGGDNPILIQSMTISDTLDTQAVVSEIEGLVKAECPLVRLTVPSVKAAENLSQIRLEMTRRGFDVPIVADIHFSPAAAVAAAEHCEKVRINPGNYADKKRFEVRDYSDAEYEEELSRARERFLPLVHRLKETGASLRIGTNHGSLSDRIMNRYGDTPEGMVESALEFVRICESVDYREIVLSIKSSIPTVMVEANRLLVERMLALGMDYPIHLGVTEAGSGLEGRVKSAIGIGTLLLEGIGDTIRVSLTEDSINEIDACRAILRAVDRSAARDGRQTGEAQPWKAPPSVEKTETKQFVIGDLKCGGFAPPRVEIQLRQKPWALDGLKSAVAETKSALQPADPAFPLQVAEILNLALPPTDRPSEITESLAVLNEAVTAAGSRPRFLLEWDMRFPGEIHSMEPALPFASAIGARFPLSGSLDPARVGLLARTAARRKKPIRFRIELDPEKDEPIGWPERAADTARELAQLSIDSGCEEISFLLAGPELVLVARTVRQYLDEQEVTRGIPIFLQLSDDPISASIVTGAVCVDGPCAGICMPAGIRGSNPEQSSTYPGDPIALAYTILQGCRLRLTRAEFITCPSCGRTQFDLQETSQRIQEKTAHLRGVKIAIMGCVVNGPGEMADADFGYVGSGPGRIDLYVGKTKVKQGLPAEEADRHLIQLIREHDMWIEPRAEKT